MSSLRLRFFGVPRFERDGRPVELTAAKAVALLAYLALADDPQPRERLLGLLWAESVEDAARKNLRNTLWAIRRALGDDVILADNDRLSLAPGIWIDVREFERIAESRWQTAGPDKPTDRSQVRPGDQPADQSGQSAQPYPPPVTGLYAGPFLDGLILVEAPEFELWMTAQRERLAQLHLRTLEGFVREHGAVGDWRQVIAVARAALAHDSLQEPIYRALMEAHARLGERGEALRQYDILRGILERELGVEPLPETEGLRGAILAGQFDRPALGQIDMAIPSVPAVAASRRTGPPALPFIGRDAERAALDAELARASAGETRVVLLTGEVGIGKSRLWREWSAGLPGGCPALEARCLEATQTLPFAPLTELFSSHTCARRLFNPDSPVPNVWLAEVTRLLPELRARVPNLSAPAALPPDEERRRVFEAFVQCFLALKGRPLIVFVDDVHWADTATLEWLGYCVHRMAERSLLLVLAYRPEDAPARLVHLVAGWGRLGVARRLPLARLTPNEAAALLAALGGDPLATPRVQAQAAGNPYFLIELYNATAGEHTDVMPVPPALGDLLRARLDRLPETARQVLQAAAVLEPDFDFATLRRTAGRSEVECLDALDALLNASVLSERGSQYAFTHPLVATVVRRGLSGARRAFLHRRAAKAIEAALAGHLEPVASRLADHYAAAGDPVQAARYADMAATHALSLAAPDEAVGFYRQALSLELTPNRQLDLGRALYWLGDVAGARTTYEAALAAFEAGGDRHGVARACLSIAESFLAVGRPDEVVRWAERGLPNLDAGSDPAAHAHAHFLLGAGRLRAGGEALAEAERHLNEAARLAREHNLPDMACHSRFELGNLQAERGDLPAALAAYREAIALAQAAGDLNQEVLGHNNTAYHALLAGDLVTAKAHMDMALALAETHKLILPRQYLYSTRGEIALAEHQWEEAERWFHQGLVEAEGNGNVEQAAKYRANLGLAARGRGDLDAALILFEEARRAAAPLTARFMQAQIDLWLVEVYRARGERAAAIEALSHAEARLAGGQYARLSAEAFHLRAALASAP